MADVFAVGAAAVREPATGSTAELAYLAARDALADAGVSETEVPAVFVGSGGHGPQPSADAVAARLGLRRLGFRGDTRIEHVSASAGEAFHRGCQAIELEVYDTVLCVGAAHAGDAWPPKPLLTARAEAARRYMSASGATVRHLAQISAKNLGHGSQAVSPDEVMCSELLDWPLTRLMVAPSRSGAAAVVLSRRRLAVDCPLVRASLLVDEREGGHAARLAYESAGVSPEDLDCAEVDDVTAAAELAAYEDLQLAPAGQGPELIDSRFTALGGVTPVNTSGGLLSLGELPGASGLSQVAQIVRQLRGKAGAQQVAGARVGLAQSGGEAVAPVALAILSA
jgi:acetyl-CoA acetyltransferase